MADSADIVIQPADDFLFDSQSGDEIPPNESVDFERLCEINHRQRIELYGKGIDVVIQVILLLNDDYEEGDKLLSYAFDYLCSRRLDTIAKYVLDRVFKNHEQPFGIATEQYIQFAITASTHGRVDVMHYFFMRVPSKKADCRLGIERYSGLFSRFDDDQLADIITVNYPVVWHAVAGWMATRNRECLEKFASVVDLMEGKCFVE